MNSLLEGVFSFSRKDFRLSATFDFHGGVGIIFGPSGSGKSTLLRVIAGLERHVEGYLHMGSTALFDQKKGVWLPPRKRSIGYLSQDAALFPHMTVEKNILYGMPPNPRKDSLKWLELMGLQGLEHRYPHQISGGQRQRVALARAFGAEPELLLLDEPFSALDGPLRRNLRRELRQLQKETKTPILCVTHSVEDVNALGDVFYFLREGTLSQGVAVEDLWSPATAYHTWEAFDWGTLFQGVVQHIQGHSWLVGDTWKLLLWGNHPEGKATAFVPPHEVKILYPDIPVDPLLGPNVFEGTVREIFSMGSFHRLDVAGNGLFWHVEYPLQSYRKLDFFQGSQIRLAISPKSIHLFHPSL